MRKIVEKCNKRKVDLDISVHFNSGRGEKNRDKKTTGSEIWCTTSSGLKRKCAERILKNLKAIGFRNRGIKITKGLYYLNHTKSKAILIEVCFVDDRDDALLYKKIGYRKIAKAIAEGITGETMETVRKYRCIKKSSSKEAICWLQRKLNDCCLQKEEKLQVDGIWGKLTQNRLESYWKQRGWKKGTYAGEKTCRALLKNRK